MESFGRKLKSAREHRGMTLSELAKLSGVSHSFISKLENGKAKHPGQDMIYKLSQTLRIDADVLIDPQKENIFDVFEAVKEPLPNKVKEFLESADMMPWVELAEQCKLNDVKPEDIRNILKAVKLLQNKN